DLAQGAGGQRLHLHRGLVSVDLGQRLTHGDLVSLFFQPTRDLSLLHRWGELRHDYLRGHILCNLWKEFLTDISNFTDGGDNSVYIRDRKVLEVLRVGHWHVRAGNAFHRCVEIIERVLHDLGADLRADTEERMRLFCNHDAVRLLD